MSRKVLLIEPDYRNKYPPLSLMKLATYHRMRGDEVVFYKGSDQDFALQETMKLLVRTLKHNDETVDWDAQWSLLAEYLKKGSREQLAELSALSEDPLVRKSLESYRRYFHNKTYLENPQWDRVCVTTLFTFYWAKTIDAINYYKQFCKDPSQVFVGGIAASVVPEEMEKETGIRPIVGLLDKGRELDPDSSVIIDTLPLDYSILEEIDYVYPEHDGYYGYMTRGCVNHCAFCVVPKLEPSYQTHIPILSKIKETEQRFGEKRNLLLLDNNVFASADFFAIIDEIKKAGFDKKTRYVAPDRYEIAVKNIRDGYNIPAYIKSLSKQYKLLVSKTKAEGEQREIMDAVIRYGLDDVHTIKVGNVLASYDYFGPKFEKLYKNKPKARYVDFNQGLDARLITDKKMAKMAEIPVRPLRIAFDHWELRDVYERAIRLAAKHGIDHLSNYLLYNFEDEPIELYYRLKMNVELSSELGINIYSFPMKYHPIQDPEYFRERTYLGRHWNRKFIRAIQAVLNATKGKIGRGVSYFDKAFGATPEEFHELLYMPEAMIVYRLYYEEKGETARWQEAFRHLSGAKRERLEVIVQKNDFTDIEHLSADEEIRNVLRFYATSRKEYEAVRERKRSSGR